MPASNLTYRRGYRNGEFFEEQIDSEEEYKAAIQAFEETYGSGVIEEQSGNLKTLLQQITGDLHQKMTEGS